MLRLSIRKLQFNLSRAGGSPKPRAKRWPESLGFYSRAIEGSRAAVYYAVRPQRTYRIRRHAHGQVRTVLVRSGVKYRGFIRKGDHVHIITFHDTTRMQSKSSRCI